MTLGRKKILIVEDDELFRDALKLILGKRYEVFTSSNGKEAKNVFVLTKFDLVISDVQMPFLNGIELLQWVKENHPTPFILMTGFSNLLETKKAHEIGADDFLSKPFSDTELLQCIENLLKPSEGEILQTPSGPNLDSEYCKVPVDDFVSEKEFKYDLFLRINESKYLKIAHKGGKVPTDRVKIFKEKGIHFFYLKKTDFSQLVNFNLQFSKTVAHSPLVNKEKKDRFIRYTGEMIVQQLMVNGLDQNNFELAKDFASMTVETLAEDHQLLQLLENFNHYADHLYVHSLAVSTFAVMIAQTLGWKRTSILFKISMAGLFHDIGLKEIPISIILKRRAEQNQQERSLFETHPFRGKEILESLRQIPSDVITVAYEHHENRIGSGYPRRLSQLKIHPLTHIISAANAFAHLTIRDPIEDSCMTPPEAIRYLEEHQKDILDPQCFEALKLMVNSNPSPKAD